MNRNNTPTLSIGEWIREMKQQQKTQRQQTMKATLMYLRQRMFQIGKLAMAVGFAPFSLGILNTAIFEAAFAPSVSAQVVACNGIPGVSNVLLSGRTLISGTNETVNARYRYNNVTGDGTTDAIVTLMNIQIPLGATLTSSDSDTAPATGSSGFNSRHLTPSFTFTSLPVNQSASISYRIEFVQAGTTTPKKLTIIPTAIDNDGDGNALRETSEFSAPNGGYLLDGSTFLAQSGNRFTSPQTQVVGFSTDARYAVGAIYFDTSSFDWTWSFSTSSGTGQSPRYGALDSACPSTFNPLPTFRVDTVKSAGTPTISGANAYDIPFTIRVGNRHTRNLPNVQVSENLTNTFSTGNPTIIISSPPTITEGTCTVNNSFNGTTNFNLLNGSNLLLPNQTCTITFTARVTYPNGTSIPSTAQNNSVFASSTSIGPNPGYTFPGGIPTPPTNSLDNDTSTNGTNLPSSADGDAASPTPVANLPRNPDLTINKAHTGNFTQGQTGATYTISVTNSGTAPTNSDVTVIDTLPSELVPTAVTGTGWICNISAQTVTCNRTTFTALDSGSSYSPITITVSVINSAPNNVINTARVSGGGQTNTANDTFNDPTTINPSSAPSPLSCDGNFYQIRVAGSGTQLFRINRNVNPYTQTQVGNITPAITLNALGYNKPDGFMYAIRTNTNELYRIDQNGAVFLGLISGLPAADYNTATFDAAGNYYVKQGTSNNIIYRINVSTRTATTITLNQSVNLGDMAFHPTDGAIYGLRDTTLYKIALSATTGIVTIVGNTNISGSPSIGSVFFDPSGTLYGYENSGIFYLINTTTGNATQLSTVPSTSQSDGASCPFTAPERVISVVKSVGAVSRVNNTTFNVPYTIVVRNTGTDTAPNTQITENLNLTFSAGNPTLAITSGSTVTNGSCTANTSFNGTTDTKLLTGTNTLSAGNSGTCTITFTVRVVYPNQASVPTTAQNNTAYGSSTLSAPNSGYTFTNGTPIPPPVLLASNQSTVSVTYPIASVPNLLLVKRITAINSTPITTIVDDPNDPNDNNPNWPAGALQGAITSSVQPQQEVEYTIYFLSAGGNDAINSTICDLIPANSKFVADTFATGRGIRQTLGTATTELTNVDDGDRGRFYTTAETLPSTCRVGSTVNGRVLNNVNGAVVVDLGTISRATAPGNPSNSYGFIRFRVRVN